MEESSEPSEASESKYQGIIISCLESIKKAVPSKRDKKLNSDIQAAIGTVHVPTPRIDYLKTNKDVKRDANQYFPLFKQGIELQNKGVTEIILKTTKELIALGYLDGDCEDTCPYPENGPQFVGKYPRRLIDGIIETICGVAQDQDENLQLQVIQVLLSVVTSFICKVHERSLLEVFRALYYIHISTKNPVNYTTSKAALNQIIHITYQRMEISYWRDSKVAHSMASALKLEGDSKEKASAGTKFTILDEYMYCAVHSIVDESCLYGAKQAKELKRGQKLQKEAKDKKIADELEAKMFKAVQGIPIRAANETQHKDDLNLVNERNAPSGKFGWCIVCRNTANSVCKTTHVPICSSDCRSRHIKMLEMLEMYLSYKEEKTKYVEDVVLLFRSVCKLSQRDLTSDVNAISLKSKILSLELILSMVQNPPESIRTNPDFLAQIKDHLSESILKNSVSNEKQIFGLSFSIFSALFVNFRSMLKNEIGVFIEEIFLKILDSGNSSYQHKFLILQVFNKIAQNPKFILEIFVNYDCDIETRNIFERIIDCLGKIAKGKYTKTEHAIIIQPEEERSLKLMALETMTAIVKNCHEYMVACDTAQAAALEEQKTPKSKKSVDPEQSKISDDMETEDLKNVSVLAEGKYEKALKNKSILNKAVLKFNIKPKNGVNYLVQVGYINNSSEKTMIEETVHFIRNTPGLDKSKIGEYFGDESDFTKKVMHAYIDSLMFKKMPFVQAMRHLVSEFRLPGESQKIDRILMKFGQKYYQDNPTQFVSANAPYELSYAVMILQTTTHNPQVKQKMSLEGFLSMSRDIRRSYNLTDDFMKTIYDDIKQNPITLADDEVAKLRQESALANGIKKKQDLFVKETQHMVKKGKELILKRKAGKGLYEEVKNAEPLRAMFEIAWSGMLAVFSSLFEEHDEGKIWQLCLEGFLYSIKITAALNMPVELDAFVSTLDKFTSLNALKDIKEKNVECVKLLIDIAMKDGNSLRNAWVFVLQCLSKLDYLHSISTAMRKEYGGRTSPRKFDTTELEGVAKVVSEIDQSKLDSIFSMSVGLDSEGITDFICNICKVSCEELAEPTNPRTFSLQKLVEVADLNMSRIAFVWKDIWKDVSRHLVEAGSHPNSSILIFALDSLKQLAHKFLAKEELSSYKYQREFLQPFETILSNNLKRHDIVDFLVYCVADVCRKCGKNIKSGWSIVFNIIGLIGKSMENERVVTGSFGILNEIIQMHYEYLAEYFEDVLSCLLQYCGNPITSVSLKGIERLNWAVGEISNPKSVLVTSLNAVLIPKETGPESKPEATVIEDSAFFCCSIQKANIITNFIELWTLLFRGLQCLIIDKRQEIREKSSVLLWDTLHKNTFTDPFWETIYEIIIGYIPKSFLHLLAEDAKTAEYVKSTLTSVIDIFAEKFAVLEKRCPDFIEKMGGFLSESDEGAAKTGIEIHKEFLQKMGGKLAKETYWEGIVGGIHKVLVGTLPKKLLEPSAVVVVANGETKLGFSEQEILAKSLIHLNVVNYVKTVVVKEAIAYMPLKISLNLLEALKESAQFAKEFNQSVDLRTKLRKAGFRGQSPQLPTLIHQEREALSGYFTLSFEIYEKHSKTDEGHVVLENMWKTMKGILEEHIKFQGKTDAIPAGEENTEAEWKRLVLGKNAIISEAILPILQKVPVAEANKEEVLDQLLDLVVSESPEIRVALRDTLKVWVKSQLPSATK